MTAETLSQLLSDQKSTGVSSKRSSHKQLSATFDRKSHQAKSISHATADSKQNKYCSPLINSLHRDINRDRESALSSHVPQNGGLLSGGNRRTQSVQRNYHQYPSGSRTNQASVRQSQNNSEMGMVKPAEDQFEVQSLKQKVRIALTDSL